MLMNDDDGYVDPLLGVCMCSCACHMTYYPPLGDSKLMRFLRLADVRLLVRFTVALVNDRRSDCASNVEAILAAALCAQCGAIHERTLPPRPRTLDDTRAPL